jgi:hypothetical protein
VGTFAFLSVMIVILGGVTIVNGFLVERLSFILVGGVMVVAGILLLTANLATGQ